MSRETTPTENVVAELRAKADAFERCYDRTMRVHELLVAIDQAAALIESQSATIQRERDKLATMTLDRDERWKRQQAAEARVTALEAEKAGLVRLLKRYRVETPLGHQPHMIAAEVDQALSRSTEKNYD